MIFFHNCSFKIAIKGGRTTHFNLVLDALPIYTMSLFSIPNGVIKRIDKIRRAILWNGKRRKRFVCNLHLLDAFLIQTLTSSKKKRRRKGSV